MNYTYLCQGDNLPTVGVLQKLLLRAGATLSADGIFGPQTVAAVQKFQRSKMLKDDGIVGVNTWEKLVEGLNLPIVDCVDVFDSFEREELNRAADRLDAAGKHSEAAALRKKASGIADSNNTEPVDLRKVGGDPIIIGGMSNGVEQAINMIANVSSETFLLRFHGHGGPGLAGISSGHGGPDERSDFNINTFPQFRSILMRLKPGFGTYGSMQFMHCETGRGAAGQSLLNSMAADLEVPVTGARNLQYAGGLKTFRFEGPTITAVPGGKSLKEWCQALPDFPKSS